MALKSRVRCHTSWAVCPALSVLALAVLSWSASAWPAQNARQENALEAPGKAEAPAPQPAISEAKSPAEANRASNGLLPMPPIAGVVVGPDGSPVAGAEVYLACYQRLRRIRTGKPTALPIEEQKRCVNWQRRAVARARTDDAGRFAIQPEPTALEYRLPRLLVVAEGLGLAYHGLRPTADDSGFALQPAEPSTADVRIQVPEMVPIRGRLLAPDGTPAKGVLVRVRFLSTTDYVLKVCHCGLDASGEPVAPASTAASSSLRQRRGHPATSGKNSLASPHAAVTHSPAYWPRPVRTDAQGWFALKGIPAGANAYLNLFHPEFAVDSLVVETRPGEIADVWRSFVSSSPPEKSWLRRVGPTFRHTLEPARPVEGVVTAGDTGKPLSDVLIDASQGAGHPAPGGIAVRTDRSGRYRFNPHVAAESNTIAVYPSPGSGYSVEREVRQGSPVRGTGVVQDFRLHRGKVIRGRVVDEETGEPIRDASVVWFPARKSAIWDPRRTTLLNPTLTDQHGRFAVTGRSGPGCLSVETSDRSYLRSPGVHRLLKDDLSMSFWWSAPMTLAPVDVPSKGDLEEEVVIRLRRGRTVALRAVGPEGQRLPIVSAVWDGVTAVHGGLAGTYLRFAQGRVVVPGVDPNHTRRVLISYYGPPNLGAVFDITPQTGDGPIDVRLQPTGTIVGQVVTPDGKPVEDAWTALTMSHDPQVVTFSRDPRGHYTHCWGTAGSLRQWPDGKFTLENVVPGIPFGLLYGSRAGPNEMITIDPLAPGERRDLGRLVAPESTTSDAEKAGPDVGNLLRLVGRIGIVPDLSEVGKNQPPKVQVLPGSPAERAGIRSGDRITALNGRTVKRIEDVAVLWNQLKSDDGLRVSLEREGKQVEAKLPAGLLQEILPAPGQDAP